MFGNYFYNEGLRRLTVAFGQIFNNIDVVTKSSTGAITKRMRVPLAYAPKEKFLVRLDQQPDLTSREFSIVLPRMGFEISGLEYDSSRKLNKLQKFKQVKDSETLEWNYTPVPYNINYSLYSFTSTAENGLQIVEQILPYFQPDYTVTINMIPKLGLKRDVPIILNTVQYEDSYSGNFETRRAVVYTLNFTAKTYLYGPMSQQGVIKKTQTDISSDLAPAAYEERIVIEPDPLSANADDDFGFTTTITFSQKGE